MPARRRTNTDAEKLQIKIIDHELTRQVSVAVPSRQYVHRIAVSKEVACWLIESEKHGWNLIVSYHESGWRNVVLVSRSGPQSVIVSDDIYPDLVLRQPGEIVPVHVHPSVKVVRG